MSSIVLTNPSSSDQVTGSIHFLDDEGEVLPIGIASAGQDQVLVSTAAVPLEVTSRVEFSILPLAAATISTDGQGEVAVGSAVVTSEAVLGGVVRFEIQGIGIAGVGASQPVKAFVAPVRRELGGINTGIALHNTESRPISLDLTLYTQGGVEAATRMIEDFPARGHVAKFIDELFPDTDTDSFEGTLVVEVTGGKVVATALELGTKPGEFTTLPVTPLQD